MNVHLKLYNSLVNKLGQDWIEIDEPEAFTFLFPELSQEQADLLGAFRAISGTILPWTNCFIFENVVDAINGNPVDTDLETQPDIDDIMYAMYVMEGVRPGVPYSTDIAKYIAARAMVEGILYVPPPANIANEFLPVPDELVPIVNKISSIPIDGILGFSPESHQTEDDLFSTQMDKLQDVLLAYRAKVDQTVDSPG